MSKRTQKERVLEYMQAHRGITSLDGHKMTPPVIDVRRRICDLREEGYPIRRIDKKSKNGIYGKWILLTGETEQCPHCGAIYDMAEIEEYDRDSQGDYWEVWHYCPACGDYIEDDPEPKPVEEETCGRDDWDDDWDADWSRRSNELAFEDRQAQISKNYWR